MTPEEPVNNLLYRASEVRAKIGCGVTKFYELINDGTLDARRFGSRTYITGESLERFVKNLPSVRTPTMMKERQEPQAGSGDPQSGVEQSRRSRFTSVAARPADAT
jgi:Helix-turn-helix domain